MRRAALVAMAMLAVGSTMDGQLFRSGTEAVHVDVLVTEGNRPVAGLTSADFELLDSGVPQRVESVGIGDIPISMMLALDTSSSVAGETLKHLGDGARAALEGLRPRDRGALVMFSNDIKIAAPWGTAPATVATAVASARAGGSTSLYDAAFIALTLHDDIPGNRGLVVVFSDGDDTASWLPARAVLDKAERTDSVVYAVVLGRPDIRRQGEGTLQRRSGIDLSPSPARSVVSQTPFLDELAQTSGGETFRTLQTGELRDAFTRILTQFRSRYLLTYAPQGVDTAGWHPIEVRLKTAKGRVTARRGYSR